MDLALEQASDPHGFGGGSRLNGPEFGDGLVVSTQNDHFAGFDLVEISGEVGFGFLDVYVGHDFIVGEMWSEVKSESWSGCAVLRDDVFV